MTEREAQWHLISTLDDIAWLLNLRGADVSFNPVFLAHVLIGPNHVWLFLLPGKIDAALAETLAADGIEVRPYEEVAQTLSELEVSSRLLFEPARTTCALIDRVSCQLVRAINPSTFFKSQKTAFELDHVRRVMEDDGAALCAFFAWLEDAIARCETTALDELMIDKELLAFRSLQPGFVSRSFGTIAAYNANGAMPHYRAMSASFAQIAGDGLLLIDSGGQYVGGTTDITRVIPVGQPNSDQKDDYTAVLQAMIALSRLKFPRGVASPMLDAVARAFMGSTRRVRAWNGAWRGVLLERARRSASDLVPRDTRTSDCHAARHDHLNELGFIVQGAGVFVSKIWSVMFLPVRLSLASFWRLRR